MEWEEAELLPEKSQGSQRGQKAREQRTEIERQREICLSCQQNAGEDS